MIPKIAMAVLVENGGFGAAAAAPIARKVLDAYLEPDDVPGGDAKKPAAPKPEPAPRPKTNAQRPASG